MLQLLLSLLLLLLRDNFPEASVLNQSLRSWILMRYILAFATAGAVVLDAVAGGVVILVIAVLNFDAVPFATAGTVVLLMLCMTLVVVVVLHAYVVAAEETQDLSVAII